MRYSVFMCCGTNKNGDSRTIERGLQWSVYVTCDGGEVVKQFAEGWINVPNLQCSGWPTDSISFDNVQHYNLLEEDHSMTILELCFHLRAIYSGRSSVHRIVHNFLDFQRMDATFVNRQTHEESNGSHPVVFVSQWLRGCRTSQADNHGRWDLYPLLHTHKQATRYDLEWTWLAYIGEGQDDSFGWWNYGNHILGQEGHFTLRIPSCGCQYHSKYLWADTENITSHYYHKHPEVRDEDIVFLDDNARPHMVCQIRDQLAHFDGKFLDTRLNLQIWHWVISI